MDERREFDIYVMIIVNMGDRLCGIIVIVTFRKMVEMSKDEFLRFSKIILEIVIWMIF